MSLDYHIQKWLAYGERVFKTDLRFLLKGGFWSTIGQFASSGSALILSVALSRWIPKEVYGEYKYVLAFVAVLGSFCLNGVGTSVFISTARGFGRALPEGFMASLKYSALVFLGALAIGAYYIYAGNMVLGIGILIGGSLVPFLISANLYTSFLAGKKDFRRLSLYGIFATVLPALGILVTALFFPSPLPLILAYFVGNTLITIAIYYFTLRTYSAMQEPSDPEMMRYAWHQSAMGVLATFTGNIDQLFLFHYIGAVEVAIYNFAIGVLDQSKGPLKSMDSMIQSRFADQENRSIRESMNNKIMWLFLIISVSITSYILAAPYIYKVLFPAYTASVIYSQVYAFSLLGIAISPTGSYISAKRKVKEQYLNTILISVLQISSIFIGIIFWGLWGLIYARIVIRIGGALVGYGIYQHLVRQETA